MKFFKEYDTINKIIFLIKNRNKYKKEKLMSNNLKKIAKELRSYAKRCKNIKYTDALLFSFLMTGLLISGASNVADKNIEQQKKILGIQF